MTGDEVDLKDRFLGLISDIVSQIWSPQREEKY